MNERLIKIQEKARIRRRAKRNILICILTATGLIGFGIFAGFRYSSDRIIEAVIAEANPPQTEPPAANSEKSASGTESLQELLQTETDSNTTQLTVSLMGDCTLGTDVNFSWDTSLNAYYEYQGGDYFFRNVKPILENDDLSIINMEGTLTETDERTPNLFAFKGKPDYTDILTSGSIEAANMANNHSHDYGEQGFSDTLRHLKSAGITTFGYDETAVMNIKGIKVGLVGIYELYDHLERTQQLIELIAKVKDEGAQIVIVVFHWGNEREIVPDSNQVTLGHLAIDEGADLVVGHHSHVLQGIEKYKGKYIAYSLANFCFGGNSNPTDKDTMIFQQTFTIEDGNLQTDDKIHIIPCSISSDNSFNNYQPTPAAGDEAERILQKIEERSQGLSKTTLNFRNHA